MLALEKQRRAKGLSYRQVERLASVDAALVSKAEKRITLYPAQLERVAAALEWQGDPADLLKEVTEDASPAA